MKYAYTNEELLALEALHNTHIPPEPTKTDISNAPRAESVGFACSVRAVLIYFDCGDHGVLTLLFNPVVAGILFIGIFVAENSSKWRINRTENEVSILPGPFPDDLKSARDVRSLRATSIETGLLVSCQTFQGPVILFLRPDVAAAVGWVIQETGKLAGWWEHIAAKEAQTRSHLN